MADRPDSDEYTIGWICALPCELAAARAVLQRHYKPPETNDQELTDGYEYGAIGANKVVVVQLPSGVYGTTSAARVVTKLRRCFPSIEYGLMVGVGGGVPTTHDIRLGDVVVGHPTPRFPGVWQYDFGKKLEDGEFSDTGVLNKPPDIFLKAIARLRSKLVPIGNTTIQGSINETLGNGHLSGGFASPGAGFDRLFVADYKHDDRSPSCDGCDPSRVVERPARKWQHPCIHYGLIASGNSVIKSGTVRNQISGSRDVLCFEMEAAGVVDELPSLVVRGICDYCDSHKNKIWQLYAALTAASYAKELLLETPRIEPKKSLKDDEYRCIRDLGGTNPQDDKTRIEKSKDTLIQESCSWILSDSSFQEWLSVEQDGTEKPILWIEGGPGKGKTMIMMSIINHLEETFRDSNATAISYFFCQATDSRLDNATAVVKGLIYQLLVHSGHRGLVRHLEREFDTGGPNCFTGLNAPYALQRVLLDIIDDDNIGRFYLLVDALDECVRDLEDLLQILSLTVSKPNKIRWLVTSRPNIQVRGELSGQGFQRRICLEDNSEHTIDAIKTYIEYKVDDLSRKKHYNPEVEAKITLILNEGAQNTFLWVHLACKELSKARASHALKVLAKLPAGLDALYNQTLARLLKHSNDDEDAVLCSRVLAAAVVAIRPLRLYELILFTEIPDEMNRGELEDIIIERCESFLLVQNGTVTFVHQSAKDFLDKQVGRPEFMPRGKAIEHRNITSSCFELLSAVLKMDVCGLGSPGLPAAALEPDAQRHLPEYACFYWVHHSVFAMTLRDEPESGEERHERCDEDQALEFLKGYFLFWVEALIIMGVFPQVVPLIRDLEAAVKNHKDLSDFLYDARRFILFHQNEISETPLQLYSSALLFAPQNSIVKRTFYHLLPSWVRQICGVSSDWDATIQILESRGATMHTMALSPDDKQLASGASNGSITLWDVTTGKLQKVLEGHTSRVTSLEYSPDGRRLASGSADQTVRIWSLPSGELIQILKQEKGPITALCFFPNSKQLAFKAAEDAMRFWKGISDEWLSDFASYTRQRDITVLAVSPDGKMLSFAINRYEGRNEVGDERFIDLEVWELSSKIKRKSFGIVYMRTAWFPKVQSIGFSPDSRQVAVAVGGLNLSSIVFVCDLISGKKIRMEAIGTASTARSLRFSKDGKTLASGTNSGDIQLWDMSSGSMVQSTYVGSGGSCLLSADLKLGASMSNIGSFIRIFDLSSASSLPSTDPRPDELENKGLFMLSPSGRKVAWTLNWCAIDPILWDIPEVEDRKLVPPAMMLQTGDRPTGSTSYVMFSADSRFLIGGKWSGYLDVWDTVSGSLVASVKTSFDLSHPAISISGRLAGVRGSDVVFCDIPALKSETTDTARGHTISPDRTPQSQVVCHEFCRHPPWEYSVLSIAFSPDGTVLASGTNLGSIYLWDVKSGKKIEHVFPMEGTRSKDDSNPPGARALAFSPDGKQLAAAFTTGIKVFHPQTGRELRHLNTLTESLCFSEDSKFLLIDRGVIDIATSQLSTTVGSWFKYQGCDILAFPRKYEPRAFAMRNNIVAVLSMSTTSCCLILDMSKLTSEECDEDQSSSSQISEFGSDSEYVESP